MLSARGVKAARGCPGSGCWVIQFGTRGSVAAAITPSCYEDFPVGKQGRCVLITRGVEIASGCPGSARWIVQFRTRRSVERAIKSSGNEYDSVGQHGCRMQKTRSIEAPRDRPSRAIQVQWRLDGRGPLGDISLTSLSQCERHHGGKQHDKKQCAPTEPPDHRSDPLVIHFVLSFTLITSNHEATPSPRNDETRMTNDEGMTKSK